jgi:hypothetical protein
MNTNFETKFGGGKVATVEWYTPPYIIEALGNDFDLDPAAPKREWYTARKCFTIDRGLASSISLSETNSFKRKSFAGSDFMYISLLVALRLKEEISLMFL